MRNNTIANIVVGVLGFLAIIFILALRIGIPVAILYFAYTLTFGAA